QNEAERAGGFGLFFVRVDRLGLNLWNRLDRVFGAVAGQPSCRSSDPADEQNQHTEAKCIGALMPSKGHAQDQGGDQRGENRQVIEEEMRVGGGHAGCACAVQPMSSSLGSSSMFGMTMISRRRFICL